MKPLDWVSPPSRELPDEEVVAESSEIERSQSHAPTEHSTNHRAANAAVGAPSETINVHEAQARAVCFKRRNLLDGLHR